MLSREFLQAALDVGAAGKPPAAGPADVLMWRWVGGWVGRWVLVLVLVPVLVPVLVLLVLVLRLRLL